ncbi:hypothetical protein tb265_31950 [Gemmatimonadetes bacterium T265]|nr:hypothetical protein tb265_31950 [Gemmatimonadetes bacterium T265]
MTDPRDLRTPEQVLADAEAFGVDLSLIRSKLRRTPEERMRLASGAAEFVRAMRQARQRLHAVAGSEPATS